MKSINHLKTLAFGIASLFALSFVHADWQDPSAGPVTSFDPPVNAGTVAQVKPGYLSVGTFWAFGNASFDQQVFFPGSIKGEAPDPADSTGINGIAAPLAIGGTDSLNGHYFVDVTATGTVKAQSLGAAELTSADGKRKLCADDQGHIVFCPPPALASATVDAEPVQGGTGDTNAVCSASLTAPAPVGGAYINLQYKINSGSSSQWYQCSIQIGEGDTSSTDYPGHEYQLDRNTNLQIIDQCFDESTSKPYLPNDPALTNIKSC